MRVKAAKTASDSPLGRSARRVSIPAAMTTVVLIQKAPIRNAQMGLSLPIRVIQPGSLGSSPVRAGLRAQNLPAAKSNSTPRSTWTMHATVVGVLLREKSWPPRKTTTKTPIARVDSVQPASHITELDGRSEASIRITATIAHGERAHTMASGSSSRKRSPTRALVLVVPTSPRPGSVAFVASLRCPVEDRVVAHQELDAAGRGGVGLVHGPVIEDECAEAGIFGKVTRDIGAARVCVVLDDRRRSRLEHRRDRLARLRLGA